jgi:hypothetical protein
MYPNFFVIGAAKSGTSALHYYLSVHPEIHMSDPKEPHFFSRSPDGTWPMGRRFTGAQYQQLFNSQLPIRGESSATYSFHPYPAGVPERIYAVAPDARFVYVVRDPVERAVAHYRYSAGLGIENRTLAEVVTDPNDAEERYIAASSYAAQVEQYQRVFPADRLLVVDHSDLLSKRLEVLRGIFTFLGVDPSFESTRFSAIVNPSSEHRLFNPAGRRIAESSAYRVATGWLRPDTRRRLIKPVRRLMSRSVSVQELTEEIRSVLAERLAPEAARLREMTGKSFETWSV